VDAFATVDQLSKKLNRQFTDAEKPWLAELLEDASTYLREDVIGQQIYPQTTSTYTAYPEGGWIDLPQHPVASIDQVERDGKPITFRRRDDSICVDGDEPVDVTFTFGLRAAPDGLARWACVLVSQTLIPLELKLGLTVGGLSSVSIDDFKASFADGGAGTGMSLSTRVEASLRSQYGSTIYTGGTR
jgi:hypothetical protein